MGLSEKISNTGTLTVISGTIVLMAAYSSYRDESDKAQFLRDLNGPRATIERHEIRAEKCKQGIYVGAGLFFMGMFSGMLSDYMDRRKKTQSLELVGN